MYKIKLSIDGMMCGMCESHVNDGIRNTFKVKKVTSSHKKGTTEIIAEEDIDEAAIREAVEKTGYRVLGVEKETYVKKGLFTRNK